MHFLETSGNETEASKTKATVSPFRSVTPVRAKLDQANLSPIVNDAKLADLGHRNTSTISPTTQPVKQQSITASTVYLPTIFPANKDGALNGTAPTIAPIYVKKIKTTNGPKTEEIGTPLNNYPTVFPGLAYPTNRPPNGSHTMNITATTPQRPQNAITANLPVNQLGNQAYGTAQYSRTTTPPTFRTTHKAAGILTTGRATSKHGVQTEENVIGEQKDEFAHQVSQPIGQTNAVVPHEVFNPEKEAEEDRAAEEERQRLLAMTPPTPVTYMRDSDEDVNSPDNEDKDNDWRGLQYGPLALPPAFKDLPSRKGMQIFTFHICMQ